MGLSGLGNYHQSEALEGALPRIQNSPQNCPYGLYAEQLSVSAFTRPRHANLHSWLYRMQPSVVHSDFVPFSHEITRELPTHQAPNPLRWAPPPAATATGDFLDGLSHIAGNTLLQAYRYQCNTSMRERCLVNQDAEMLYVPQSGRLRLCTEFGILQVHPGMIALVPRGVVHRVELLDNTASGYLCENAGVPLALPELGPIGANGLANPRHFLYPNAAFDEPGTPTRLIAKSQNVWWQAECPSSPLNVVAWQGNLAPFVYDLSLFNTINTVSFDHPDPSIFTVLTSPGAVPGEATLDFVIFPPRWMVAENTFRPPWFHKNCMSEFMGLIRGEYDAKKEGFLPGGVSIHNAMTAHGPDLQSFEAATREELRPERYENTLAFMFETREPWRVTAEAMKCPTRDRNYTQCWQDLPIRCRCRRPE